MELPSDDYILLSYINTQLRDYYNSLDKLCKVFDYDKKTIIKRLATLDYEYDEKLNKFI